MAKEAKKEKKERPLRDYRDLRKRQHETSLSQKFKNNKGEIRDDNPPENKDRNYESLKKIKMPLILDLLDKKCIAWTVEEVVKAMDPIIISLAKMKCGSGSEFDQALSFGRQAVLDALYSDAGLAWFASYCYQKIHAAIKRVANKGYARNRRTRSLNEPLENGAELIDVIEVTKQWNSAPCGDYMLDGRVVPSNTKGCKFVPTCKRAPNGTYMKDGNTCERCAGSGHKIIASKKPISSVDDKIVSQERLSIIKDLITASMDCLTENQKWVVETKIGLDGKDEKDFQEVAELYQEKQRQEMERLRKEAEKEGKEFEEDEVMLGSKNRMIQIYEKSIKKMMDNMLEKGMTKDVLFTLFGETNEDSGD